MKGKVHMSNPRLKGSLAIARALGVSSKTVQRYGRKGLIPVVKLGEHTSPWTISRADLEQLKRPLLPENKD